MKIVNHDSEQATSSTMPNNNGLIYINKRKYLHIENSYKSYEEASARTKRHRRSIISTVINELTYNESDKMLMIQHLIQNTFKHYLSPQTLFIMNESNITQYQLAKLRSSL